jgi:DNA-binding MurR/RpiR family transcriptional regulator
MVSHFNRLCKKPNDATTIADGDALLVFVWPGGAIPRGGGRLTELATQDFLAVPVELERFSRLSPKHQMVVRFIAENPAVAAFATASELGSRIGVSAATVVRLAQALGFSGYPEFQQNVRHSYLRTLRPLEVLERQHHEQEDHLRAQIFQDIENLRRMVDSLHMDVLSKVVRLIGEASQIVIISAGTHSSVALVLGAHLRFMGYRAVVEDRGGPHLTAAIAPLGPGDLVIGITFWKGIREVVKAVEWAASRGIATVGITDTIYSPIAKAASLSLALPTEGTSFFQSMVGPLSIVNGILAHLAQHAEPWRKDLMEEADRSYDLLDCMAGPAQPTPVGTS